MVFLSQNFQLNQPRPNGIDHWRSLIGPTRFYWNLLKSHQSHSLTVVCFQFKGFWSKEEGAKKYSRTVWWSWRWFKVLVSKYDNLFEDNLYLKHNVMDNFESGQERCARKRLLWGCRPRNWLAVPNNYWQDFWSSFNVCPQHIPLQAMRTGSTLAVGFRTLLRRSEKSRRPILQGGFNNAWPALTISHQVCRANAPAGLDCDVSDEARWTSSMVSQLRSHPINFKLVWLNSLPGWLTGWGRTTQARTRHRVPHQPPRRRRHQPQHLRLLLQHHHPP